ncbi:MAG: low molecular weight protein-tyrosine-phosphatase [Spirochaetales bacterium]
MNILFVCTGNICRSPLAEVIFRELVRNEGLEAEILVDSAGTEGYHEGDPADERSRRTARSRGLEITHRSREIRATDFTKFDRIIAMDSHNLRDLQRLARGERERRKISLLRDFDPSGPGDVPDPYYGSLDDFEMVWHMCERSAPRLLDYLKAFGLEAFEEPTGRLTGR